ncbi:MAG: hypothetical protein ACK4NA_00370 [Alphaproteobacteria bacterium]
MTSNLKKTFLASAAALALTAGFAAGPANAFDRSYWTFRVDIDPCIDINVSLDPDSLTAVEIEQSSIGDISAISIVKDIAVVQLNTQSGGYGHHSNHHGNGNSVPAMDALTELGQVVSSATAVANNANITSVTEGVFVDVSQTATDGYHSGGDVLAKSVVINIEDLMVDSTATAVANNLNLSVDPASIVGGTTVVANIEQKSVMDVTAVSYVKGVTLTNFRNIGSVAGPVISSAATAVGNNVNVTVAMP